MHSRLRTIISTSVLRREWESRLADNGRPGGRTPLLVYLSSLALLSSPAVRGEDEPLPGSKVVQEISYDNYRKPAGPWSIHVVRMSRKSIQFQLRTMHATGKALGLTPVTDQTNPTNAAPGIPVAAINGDFYQREGPYAGDPRGLQIVEGELISAPTGGASFCVDLIGEPRTVNAVSRLQVSWPNGSTNPIGLNENRLANRITLYTPALGPSTHTAAGRELVLERQGNNPWLPLRAGRTYRARVREIRESGNTQILPETMVLSIGPAALKSVPPVEAGTELIISTLTEPVLRGVRTAISGGPVLVQTGKRARFKAPDSDSYEFSSMMERHPRSAVGWNEDYFFLVTVDGRQKGVSAGMTLDEFASYLVKLGCQEAMNLDGGGSATLWYEGKVRNQPCDGYEREVANSLIVCKRPAGTRAPTKTQGP
ncbi:MAG TPA: phosphodiester glycosidase family protein [Verrucomicrobiae bacterium]|nr:phosphodiester glycosidase family protein [Verrucomicrobiae bacterium]